MTRTRAISIADLKRERRIFGLWMAALVLPFVVSSLSMHFDRHTSDIPDVLFFEVPIGLGVIFLFWLPIHIAFRILFVLGYAPLMPSLLFIHLLIFFGP